MCTLSRLATGAVATVALAFTLSSPDQPTRAAQASLPSITLEGFGHVRTNERDSTYSQGLTHRHVDGELRFLILTLQRQLHEFRPPAAGQTETATTATWDLSRTDAFLNGFHGIWYEEAKDRLWITSAADYTATNHPARITIVALQSGGSVRVVKQFFLDKPAKRVYGGCTAVPSALVDRFGGQYVCGWGGYTSLVMNGGNASIGPTMYAIPDPDEIANGATVQTRTILDTANAQSNRGLRLTIPQNYFDGGDPRQNPSTRPTNPPRSSGRWLSPNEEGLGWMVWGDSYYNTGVWIGTTFAAVASLCKGACWYQSSTLAFDDRQYELHLWNGHRLGSNILERPDRMTELVLPRGNDRVWKGNTPVGNIGGATYDEQSGRLYLIGFPLGPDDYTGRLYTFRVDGGDSPTLPPSDAVVSEWSAWTALTDWSVCEDGVQSRRERRTRSVVRPPTSGGSTPPLEEERSSSRSCGRRAPLSAALIGDGFDRPAAVVSHPSDRSTQFVVERSGRIRTLQGGQTQAVDVLDLSESVGISPTGGLLALALAPDFMRSGRAYVAFHDQSANIVIARFTRRAGDSLSLDPGTRFDLVWPGGSGSIDQPTTSASGAGLAFGPDGYLYVSVSAAGAGATPPFVSQHPRSLLGKMLRIDVDVPLSDSTGYRIPADNPWAESADVLPEIWAFGLRDPRGWTFDRFGSDALVIPDAGESVQEITYVPTGSSGQNLGWPARQGRRSFLPSVPAFGDATLDAAWEYDSSVGRAIVGGHVYRGDGLGPAFGGRFFFGDALSHRVWSVQIDTTTGVASDLIDHSSELGEAAARPAAIGADAAGELLIVSQSGTIYRIESVGDSRRPADGGAVGRARPR